MESLKKASIELLGETFHVTYENESEIEYCFNFLKDLVNKIKLNNPSMTLSQVLFFSSIKMIEAYKNLNENETSGKFYMEEYNLSMQKIEYFLNSIINIIEKDS